MRSPSARRHPLRIFASAFVIVFLAITFIGAAATLSGGSVHDAFAQPEPAEVEESEAPAVDDVVDGGDAEADGDAAAPDDGTVSLSIENDDTPLSARLMSFFGIFGLLGIAWLLSNNRRAVDWKLVAMGVGIQLVFALFVLKTTIGEQIFAGANAVVMQLLAFTEAGSRLLFGFDGQLIQYFAFGVLPTIIFFSSLMTVLYHLGVMQVIVRWVAWAMRRTMGTSGSETLSAAANIFVGQTEAPLMIKPYVSSMTKSELMAVMTGGFATVAGGVLAAYVGFLRDVFPDIAGHLMAASVLSAPAALVVAKVMFPETEDSPTRGDVKLDVESDDANVIDAAARGAGEGLTLALNVGAMLLAFVALVAMINYMFALPSYVQHGSALNAVVEQVEDAGLEIPADVASVCAPDAVREATGAGVALEARSGCIAQIQDAVWPESDEEGAAQAPPLTVWPTITLEKIFGVLFWPIAFLMGVPIADCFLVGQLLGTKMVINEFVAYDNLSRILRDPSIQLHPRSMVIATYALCGFANFGSIAIQIGGIGGIAPERRHDLAKLGIRAMIGGSLAAFMTATVAGILV